jgi:heme/copper-type cytochrome/quinol oxidase subunit 3
VVAEQQPTDAGTDHRGGSSITVGQLGMWVFISTEVMLFAGIIATYLVLRLTTMQTGWPSRADMHVSMLTGILNTLILIVSGVFVWNAWSACREDRPRAARLWLLVTMALGLAFLGIKSHEYYEKFRIGLMPIPGQNQFHERANYRYLTHVTNRLQGSIARLEARPQLSEENQQHLETLYWLKQNMAEATARNAGRTSSSFHAQLCLNLMAYQIYPHPDTGRNVEDVYLPERQRLGRELDKGYERLMLVQQRQALVRQQIGQLEEEIQQAELLGSENEQLQQKTEWLQTKNNQQQELEVESRRLQSLIDPMQGRVDYLNELFEFGEDEEFQGINERFEQMRLPVVIPNGQAWISAYLLLTGTHALHLIAGLLALAWWIPRKLVSRQAPALYVTCMYWQFVDAIWLVIFGFVYF